MSVFDGDAFIALVETLPADSAEDQQTKALAVGAARGFVRLVQCLERIAAAQEILASPPLSAESSTELGQHREP